MFFISNTADGSRLPRIKEIVGKLGKEKSTRQTYATARRVVGRLAERVPGLDKPLYVGLMHEGTQNGVLLLNARFAVNMTPLPTPC